MAMSVGLEPKELKAALEGVMPWLTPTGLALEALEKLDRPLLAWMQDPELHMFDSAAHYAEYADEPGGLSRLESNCQELWISGVVQAAVTSGRSTR
ncbi:hypothetical protein [Streptomyces sp. NPDC048392]|uniref:hypothetical protein n=1 Tax=Streptomyces sp. NPDC048392 TaxID=3365543 RepID=UPI00371B0521